ncbi:MAG: hypothetical protein QHJ73_02740, partial [Armatimonadota bacterium]|nr:hypothetical protein [Armatimonadota bacterium]
TAGSRACARLRVVCSGGTYLRALAADLGTALQLPAYLAALTRTRVGSFPLEEAVALDDLASCVERAGSSQAPEVVKLLLPPQRAVAHLPRVEVWGDALDRVRHGNSFAVPGDSAGHAGVVRIETPEGVLVGVGRQERAAEGWVVRPTKVLLPA